MSNRIFITFLGTGIYAKRNDEIGYETVKYEFEDGRSNYTPFAQVATVEWIGVENIDRYLVLITKESRDKHWDLLVEAWNKVGVSSDLIVPILISTDQSKEAQWGWFQELFHHVDTGDKLSFDFTHGFRSVPILFSTAINFLQKSKGVELKHAFYGYVEYGKSVGEMIDMADFYRINDWADGVVALVDSADPTKLNRLAEEEDESSPFGSINNPKLIAELDKLSLQIGSVDVENVAKTARTACRLIRKQQDSDSSKPDQFLLNMLLDKFVPLAQKTTKYYDWTYFTMQCTLIEVLFEHRFYMQAFTAMRELMGTIGLPYLVDVENLDIMSQSRQFHRAYADLFFTMCQIAEKRWEFTTMYANNPKKMTRFNHLLVVWQAFTRDEKDSLFDLSQTISKLRNGFDHAWLGKKGVPPDVQKRCSECLSALRDLLIQLKLMA